MAPSRTLLERTANASFSSCNCLSIHSTTICFFSRCSTIHVDADFFRPARFGDLTSFGWSAASTVLVDSAIAIVVHTVATDLGAARVCSWIPVVAVSARRRPPVAIVVALATATLRTNWDRRRRPQRCMCK